MSSWYTSAFKVSFRPDASRRLGQSRQQLPGCSTPHRHHFLEAYGEQRAVSREAAAAGDQAVVGTDEFTRPGRTFICRHKEEGGINSVMKKKFKIGSSWTVLPPPPDWDGSASCQALKCPSLPLDTNVVVRPSATAGLKHMAVIWASWGAETMVLSTKLWEGQTEGQNKEKDRLTRYQEEPDLWVWSSKRQIFRFSSTSAASCSLSSTVANQEPEASKATWTTSNCRRPDWWMNSCCTMSSWTEETQKLINLFDLEEL